MASKSTVTSTSSVEQKSVQFSRPDFVGYPTNVTREITGWKLEPPSPSSPFSPSSTTPLSHSLKVVSGASVSRSGGSGIPSTRSAWTVVPTSSDEERKARERREEEANNAMRASQAGYFHEDYPYLDCGFENCRRCRK